MAKPQTNISIAAPGFGGINSELAAVQQAEVFAQTADNCIIDQFGRIAARKGFELVTTNGSAYSSAEVDIVHEFLGDDGTKVVFSAAGNKLFKAADVPADVTPGGATITDDDWQMVQLDNVLYFFQYGHDPIHFSHTTGGSGTVAVNTSTPTAMPKAACALSAYGRLWCANTDTDNGQVVYWSTLGDGKDWDTADAGTINIEEFWPTGYDEIQALAAHNGKLVIFGKNNIVIYANPDGDPAATSGLSLDDTIPNIGCIARDTVHSTGTDLLFLDRTGVRSLNRTIQEKSLPMGEASKNVRNALLADIDEETDSTRIRGCFSPENRFYLLIFPESNKAYVFNTKIVDPDGSMRITTWSGIGARFAYNHDGVLYFADEASAITKYNDYADGSDAYRMRYYTNPLSFGDSTKLKIPKQVDLTLLTAATGDVTVYWAYDYEQTFSSAPVTLSGATATAEYNIAEYNIGEYSGGIVLSRKKRNVTGSGAVVQIGVEVDINGSSFSLQELNIQAILGRIL